MSINDNLIGIHQRITLAANKVGRDPKSIRLVAVSKRFPTSHILEANSSGQLLFGENYIQEAQEKYQQLRMATTFSGKLHFIGHLQTNKVKFAAKICTMIETIDRLKLAKECNRQLEKLNRSMEVLIQVNIGKDENKSGIGVDEAEQLLRDIQTLNLTRLQIRGLMTMPPITDNQEETRHYFRALRHLSLELAEKKLFHDNQKAELSMGMSGEFEIAIEEGATLVIIGTAIFGERPALQKR